MVKKTKKVKLPRKRKKAYIKKMRRNNYRGMLVFLPMEGQTKFPKDVVGGFDENHLPCFITLNYW